MRILDLNPEAQSAAAWRRPGRGRMTFAVVVSTLVHGAALVLLVWRPAIFVKPRLVAHGEGGSATPVSVTLYLPRSGGLAAPVHPSLLSLPTPVRKPPQRKRSNALENDRHADSAESGSPEGSAFAGPAEGDEVRPAIPLPGSFADPVVSRWELPAGFQGEVIVEITIDDRGVVVDEKLLQGLGHGIDERVIAALRDWRFRPATRNGVAIFSKHDVHFHFPS